MKTVMLSPAQRPLFLPLALLLAGSALADTVYDSTPNRSDAWVSVKNPNNGRQMEIGDEITLAGTARTVTSFIYEYFGDFAAGANPGASAVVRLYANNGPGYFENGVQFGQMPGSLLWESQPVSVPSTLNRQFSQVTLSLPNVVVPDKIIWTIKFSGLTTGDVGLTISDPVVIGGRLPGTTHDVIGSYADYWGKNDPLRADSWALFSVFPNKANFHAKITAVPEPGTVALCSVAGVFLLLVGRNRR